MPHPGRAFPQRLCWDPAEFQKPQNSEVQIRGGIGVDRQRFVNGTAAGHIGLPDHQK